MRDGVPFDAALERALAPLQGADRRLAHELAAGVLRSGAALDRALAPYVTRGLEQVDPSLRELLRLGAYQLTALDRIPPHAAVSTSVALAQDSPHRRAAAFVNAVLRRVAESAPRTVPGRASHPGWLVSRWTARYGPTETARLQEWNDTRPRLALQPARWTLDQVRAALTAAGVEVSDAPFGAGLLPRASRPKDLPGYADGGFIVQDPAQAMVVRFFDVPAGATVYDACAAPGGKSIGLGLVAGRILAADRRLSRVARLAENLQRAGQGREFPLVADAAHPPVRQVDVAVLDAPCLGTGVFARHPDARWRVRPDALPHLVREAEAMLEAMATIVRPGGWLCFSTCSLEPEENEMQIAAFLMRHPEFQRDPGPAPDEALTPAGDLVLLPQRHGMDGAFASRLRRAAP